MDRLEILRKSRYFEKNSGLGPALAETYQEYTVGPYGPMLTPATRDDEWNQRTSDWIAEWYPLADVTSRQGYGGLMGEAAWCTFWDGGCFLLKTSGENRAHPRLQLIEAHRVATPPSMFDQEGATIVNGVKLDASRRRPAGYYIREGDDENYTFRTSNEVIHIFERYRPSQFREVPMLAPVLNYLHDFDDLFRFEMMAAKDAAEKSIIVKNASGEANRRDSLRNLYAATPGSKTETKPDDWKTRTEYYKKAGWAKTLFMKMGEDVTQFKSERPSVSTQWFFDYIATQVCMGVGIPKMLVMPWSIQGTIGRGEYERARNYFLSRFTTFQSVAQQIYWFIIGVARFSDPRIADAPADWTKVVIRPPRTVNVDVGRNSAATIADLDANLTTLEEQFAMRGLDWREQTRQRIREETFIDAECAKVGLSPARIRSSLQKSAAETPATEPGNPTEDVKVAMDAYGVGVRAGAITPNDEDEKHFRERMQLPAANSNVRRAWSEDDGTRRPITITQPPGQEAAAPALQPEIEE